MTDQILCVFCKHWDFDNGSPHYSEYTPGEDASMSCTQGHFATTYFSSLSTADFRKTILTAKTCFHYERDAK